MIYISPGEQQEQAIEAGPGQMLALHALAYPAGHLSVSIQQNGVELSKHSFGPIPGDRPAWRLTIPEGSYILVASFESSDPTAYGEFEAVVE